LIREDFLVDAKISGRRAGLVKQFAFPERLGRLHGGGGCHVVMDVRSRRRRFWLLEFLVATAMTVAILSVPIPIVERGSLEAAEMMTVRRMDVVRQCQAQYRSQFGKYAAMLAELGPQGANLIPASLASGEKDGYRFVLTAVPDGYTLVARPQVFGKTGRRTFFLDQDGIVHQNWGPELASLDSPEFK
jgi:hypothetical protein